MQESMFLPIISLKTCFKYAARYCVNNVSGETTMKNRGNHFGYIC